MLKKIDHIGLVVKDADQTAQLFSSTFGFQMVNRPPYRDPQGEFTSVFIVLGDIKIELITPTTADNALGRFIAKRGEGFHHVSFQVDNVDQELESLQAKNVRLINEKPDIVEDDKVAFVHPSAVKGVLVELLEKSSAQPGHRE